jgi:hypothetical protein
MPSSPIAPARDRTIEREKAKARFRARYIRNEAPA